MTTAMKAKKELLASQVSNLVSDTNENLLRVNLSKFFTDLEAEIQKALLEYWNDTLLLQGQINLILSPIHEKHQEYYELIMTHKLQEFRRAQKLGERLVKREQEKVAMKAAQPVKFIHNEDNLFGTLEYTEERLSDYTFTASQNTLNRVDGNINEILTTGYREGKGINDVSRKITERFDQLRTWEANRIARTEIHTSQNMGIMSSYESLGVEYTQWSAAHDSRTRHSHIEIDGEIIPFGGTYSNKLRYPGDTSGPIEEWINCRCANAPFVMPVGMMAPSFSPFREEDLVPVPVVEEPQVIEPTREQLQTNLTKQEREEYRWAKNVQTSEFIGDIGKAKARETLEQLRQKALTGTPKPKSAPKPVEPVKTKPKTKSAESMTSDELYESMTKTDKKKYDKAKQQLDKAKSNIDKLGNNQLLQDIYDKKLKEVRKLEQKQIDKLNKKSKPKKSKPQNPIHDKPLEEIHKNTPYFEKWEDVKKELPLSDKSINKLEKWSNKRADGNVEWGYRFNVKTGELMGKDFRGGRSGVTLKGSDKDVGSIHVHTNELSPWPSGADIKAYRCDDCPSHIVMSESQVWIIEANESFGMMGRLVQTDIDAVYTNVVYESNKYLEKQLRNGKLKPNEKAIKEASDLDIGNRLLKEFSKKEWKDKGLRVRRAFR